MQSWRYKVAQLTLSSEKVSHGTEKYLILRLV
jgi:hypothetical protein